MSVENVPNQRPNNGDRHLDLRTWGAIGILGILAAIGLGVPYYASQTQPQPWQITPQPELATPGAMESLHTTVPVLVPSVTPTLTALPIGPNGVPIGEGKG